VTTDFNKNAFILFEQGLFGELEIILFLGRWNPDQDDFSDVFCAGYMLSELVALETKTQIAGVTNIADATGRALRSVIIVSL